MIQPSATMSRRAVVIDLVSDEEDEEMDDYETQAPIIKTEPDDQVYSHKMAHGGRNWHIPSTSGRRDIDMQGESSEVQRGRRRSDVSRASTDTPRRNSDVQRTPTRMERRNKHRASTDEQARTADVQRLSTNTQRRPSSEHRLTEDNLVDNVPENIRDLLPEGIEIHPQYSLTEQRCDTTVSEPQRPTTAQRTQQVLYKCYLCEIHLSSLFQLDDHLRDCHTGRSRVTITRPCKYCARQFYTKYCDIHERDHNHDFIIRENAIAKCNKCSVYFHSFRVYHNHMSGHKSGASVTENSKKPCPSKDCGLSFIKKDFEHHCRWFHIELQLRKKDMFVIESLKDIRKRKVCGRPSGRVTVYKCAECNVCFFSRVKCNKHFHRHVALADIEVLKCKGCSLQFPYTTIQKHILKHHIKKKYNYDDFLIEELTRHLEEGYN